MSRRLEDRERGQCRALDSFVMNIEILCEEMIKLNENHPVASMCSNFIFHS